MRGPVVVWEVPGGQRVSGFLSRDKLSPGVVGESR